MVRLILWLILAIIVWRLLAGVIRGVLRGAASGSGGGKTSTVGLVRDPVCGMFVTPANALSSGSGSDTRYFCSERCRQEFARQG